jgi:hypothetical protein
MTYDIATMSFGTTYHVLSDFYHAYDTSYYVMGDMYYVYTYFTISRGTFHIPYLTVTMSLDILSADTFYFSKIY